MAKKIAAAADHGLALSSFAGITTSQAVSGPTLNEGYLQAETRAACPSRSMSANHDVRPGGGAVPRPVFDRMSELSSAVFQKSGLSARQRPLLFQYLPADDFH